MKFLSFVLLAAVLFLGLVIFYLKKRPGPTPIEVERTVEKIIYEQVPSRNDFKPIIREGHIINFNQQNTK